MRRKLKVISLALSCSMLFSLGGMSLCAFAENAETPDSVEEEHPGGVLPVANRYMVLDKLGVENFEGVWERGIGNKLYLPNSTDYIEFDEELAAENGLVFENPTLYGDITTKLANKKHHHFGDDLSKIVSVDYLSEKGKICTGALFTVEETKNLPPSLYDESGEISSDREEYKEYKAYMIVPGDVAGGKDDTHGDGEIDVLDVVATRACIVNSIQPKRVIFEAMDISGDFHIDVADLVLMRAIATGNKKYSDL